MRNLLLATAVIVAGFCFVSTAQAQYGCGYRGYGHGGYYRAPVATYYRGYGYGYVPRVYTYSYGPGYYPNRSYYGSYYRGGYYGGYYGGRGGVSVRIGF